MASDEWVENVVAIELNKAFKKAAELVRAKARSITDWGYDPSATEDTRIVDEARNAANEAVRTALREVADALEETGS